MLVAPAVKVGREEVAAMEAGGCSTLGVVTGLDVAGDTVTPPSCSGRC